MDEWIYPAIEYSLVKIRQNLAELESFPELTENGCWRTVDDGGWVGGHWVGLLWLAFSYTQDPSLESAARAWAARLTQRQFDSTTHDLGFLFELSHVLGYRLCRDESLGTPALQAARTLSLRFNPRGGYFQAWGALTAPPEDRGRAIVDTMMNLDLLFWANEQTGDLSLAEMAETHARTAVKYQIRPDFSTSHVIYFDPESGAFLRQDTHQGLSGTSCWSRGQSWAAYGFGDCFRATGEAIFLKTARNLADYVLDHLPEDLVPFWDYASPAIPDDVRDSSAAAIFASALLQLADLETSAENVARWRATGISILRSLWEHYSSRDTSEASILLHGTRSKPHGLMDHGLIYGDYYFVEALLSCVPAPAQLGST